MSRKMTEKIFSLVFWEDLNSHSVIKTSSIKRAIKTGKLTAKKNNKNEAVKILLQDDDKEYLAMVDVDKNGRISLNKTKQNVKKGNKKGTKIKTSGAIDRQMNDDDIIQTKSIFDENSDEPSSSTSKLRRVSRQIISSDDSEPEEERDSSEKADVVRNKNDVKKMIPDSRFSTKDHSKKVSSSSIKPRISNRMIISSNSEDEDNEPKTVKKVISFKRQDRTNLKQNDDESREIVNVNKYERAVSKVRPRNEETNKETKAGSVVNSPMHNKRNPRSTSPVGFYIGKMTSSTLKRRAISLVFTSSDEESGPVVVKNLPKKINENLIQDVQKGLVQYSEPSDDAEGDYDINSPGNNEVVNKKDSEGDSDTNSQSYHKVDNKEESEDYSDANSRGNDQVANKKTSDNFSKINDDIEEIIIIDGQKESNTKFTKKNNLEEDVRKGNQINRKESFSTHSSDPSKSQNSSNLKALIDFTSKNQSKSKDSPGTSKLDEVDDDQISAEGKI